MIPCENHPYTLTHQTPLPPKGRRGADQLPLALEEQLHANGKALGPEVTAPEGEQRGRGDARRHQARGDARGVHPPEVDRV